MSKTVNRKMYISRNERIGGVIYVLLFFIMGVGLCSWLLVSQNDIGHVFSRKDAVNAKMKRQQDFRREQENSMESCNIIVERIYTYNPGINAVYEKNDIQLIINEFRKNYEYHRMDKRYMAYLHLSDFYQVLFNDKQYLWSLRSNLQYVKNNLEECELGLRRRREELRNNR